MAGALLTLTLSLVLGTACGGGDEPGADGSTSGSSDPSALPGSSNGGHAGGLKVSSSAMRRLSVHELTNTFEAVVGFAPNALERLPPDGLGHTFDRVVNAQTMSPAHLEGYAAIATEVSSSLIGERRLDELVSGCPDSSIPSPVRSEIATVNGSTLGVGPAWAVSGSGNGLHISTMYAPDVEAAYAHAFSTPGDYELRFAVDIDGPVDTANIVVDGEVVATQTNVNGAATVSATVHIAEARTYVIELSLQTEPDDNSLGLTFEALTIEGPLAEMAQPDEAEVKDCATSIIEELVPRAYRRPVADEERERLNGLYDEVALSYGPADALGSLLEAVFASPHFLFLVELGEPVADRQGMFRLGAHELAARLSYALCEQPPDEQLAAAAASAELLEEGQLEAHARRLLEAPCARGAVERFLEHWLWLNRLPSLTKSPELFPEFTDQVRDGLVAEGKRHFAELVWGQHATVSTLFETSHAWPDATTAFLYGFTSGNGEQTTLPDERAGILTSPGVLAVTAPFDGTSPVERGVFVLEQILCSEMPPPPADVDIVPPPPDPNLTTRERWAAHTENPECAGCHQIIDPIGFAFEDFDGIGRHRSEENGAPIDAVGGVPLIGVENGSVTGGAALARVVAGSDELKACAARQWLRFSLGRLETAEDKDALDELTASFEAGSIHEALVTIVTTDAFLHRAEEK